MGGVGGQILKSSTVTIKNGKSIKYYHIWLLSKGDKIEYQLTTPGKENYSSNKLTKNTTDINNFLKQLLKINALGDYHVKIEEYLNEQTN